MTYPEIGAVLAGDIRVFPRRTNATPTDDLVFVGDPPMFRPAEGRVFVSCAFTWDVPEATRLAKAWGHYYSDVAVGGPAFDDDGGDFTPGRFLGEGHIITSRGCPCKCEGCFVPRREGRIRTLPITDGWLLHDNNILACPDEHIADVWAMLVRQPHRPEFTGGIESSRVTESIASEFVRIRTEQLFLAYDRPSQKEPTTKAIEMLLAAGLRGRAIRCYVLIGYPGDTPWNATARLQYIFDCGATPFAMYFQDSDSRGAVPGEWRAIVRKWTRPAAMFARIRDTERPLFT